MEASTIIALIAAGSAGFSAYLTYRASVKATTVSDKKVDQEAYDRAVIFYQKQLEDTGKQLDRATGQIDKLSQQMEKVTNQLASEQDISNTLRNQIRTLQDQINTLQGTVTDLRGRLESYKTSGPINIPPVIGKAK